MSEAEPLGPSGSPASPTSPTSPAPDWFMDVTQQDQFLGTCVTGLGSLLGSTSSSQVGAALGGGARPQTQATMTAITRDLSKTLRLLRQNQGGDVWRAIQSIEENGGHVDAFSGFFVVLSEDVDCLYVSPNVHRHTGLHQKEVMGESFLKFIHEEDCAKVIRFMSRQKNNLPATSTSTFTSTAAPSPTQSLASCPSTTSSASVSSNSARPLNGSKSSSRRQFFHFRFMLKGEYDHVNMMGHYRQIGEDTFIFLGIVRPVEDRPITDLSLVEATQNQYVTRHLPDGKIIFADHRITTHIGYLPSEVAGKSAFNYILGEDLPWTTMAQRHMFANTSGEGFTTYRLLCRDGNYITLQTRGYLEFNKHTQKVESFMAVNTILDDEEGKKYLEQQRERFTPYIEIYEREIINDNQSTKQLKLLLSSINKTVDPRKRQIPMESALGSSRCHEDSESDRARAPKYRVLEGNRVVEIESSNGNGIEIISQVGTTTEDAGSPKKQKDTGGSP
ncbi:circadian locomoter output cycles protein kaput-like [Tigriopus californicus]|uniref:circadian locomoter output cycles protein kaput-like n=1 Tax=Tigriopus californicus TaxID=6832 RepID=UPI0027DA0F94|nr:circadian locomoter output cycles protein kaput-like [Tigriopus californicus]